jgi:hypothetical protein
VPEERQAADREIGNVAETTGFVGVFRVKSALSEERFTKAGRWICH